MSDLISRNEVNDVIDELEVYTSGRPNTTKVEISVLQLKRLINKLKNIPTTYDIDKVIEELKIIKEDALAEYNMGEYNLDNNIGNSISENYRKDMNEGKCFAYDEAIEIIKQGKEGINIMEHNSIEELKQAAKNTNELLDHLTEIIEQNDERFSFEWLVGGEHAIMEIFDKEKEIGYVVNIEPIKDVCEYRKIKGNNCLFETNCGNVSGMYRGFNFCPYCGKKIKVME